MPSPNTRNGISVIICAFDEKRLGDLVEAVESVKRQACPALEIIVVIDHNEALLRTARGCLQDVILIENKEGQGASGARNSGVAAARGEIVAFIDDDAVAEPGWLAQLVSLFDLETILAAGGRIEPLWLSPQPKWLPEEFYWVIGASYRGLPNQVAPVRNLWTGNIAVRRDAFLDAGGFRKGFGKVGSRSSPEDTDFCIRLRDRFPHGTIMFKPEAKVRHKVPAHRLTWKFFIARCYNEGLGKVQLTRLVGAKTGMSTERSHLARALPAGVARGLLDGLLRLDPAGFLRAAAIVVGLSVTAAGYLAGLLETCLPKRPAQSSLPRPDPSQYAKPDGVKNAHPG